jgi:hypothetical protein
MDVNEIEDQLDNWRNVEYRMGAEGTAYCFLHYSSWEEIEDVEFHILRKMLIDTIEAMENLVETRINDLENKL